MRHQRREFLRRIKNQEGAKTCGCYIHEMEDDQLDAKGSSDEDCDLPPSKDSSEQVDEEGEGGSEATDGTELSQKEQKPSALTKKVVEALEMKHRRGKSSPLKEGKRS